MSIPISGLNTIVIVTGSDFIPLVQSSSLTTYRTTLSSLLNLEAISGSARSASYAVSASNAFTASYSFLSTSASYALSASEASVSMTSSYSLKALSASYAGTSSVCTGTASYANSNVSSSYALNSSTSSFLIYGGFPNGTASYALSCPTVVSASWASSSISSSYSTTSSYATTSSYSTTSSYAITSSYAGVAGIANSVIGTIGFNLTVITSVGLGLNADSTWRTMDVSSYVPSNAKFAYVFFTVNDANNNGSLAVSSDNTTKPVLTIINWTMRSGGNGIIYNNTVFVPLGSRGHTRTFDYNCSTNQFGALATLQGYTT